ncbi:MAG: aminopeptidase P family protein [Bacteroidaceae bacterium]|nr:aminopeptidase P family protein [Bacteroidaceae bacterium]
MSTMNKITLLRQWMREQDLAAFIFPSTDPHSGEYVPDHWKTREWISGFNGSAGTAVVALDDAALWTDSRYWLAAEEQTAGTGFTVIRCRRNVPTGQELAEWIKEKCKPTLYGAPLRVGIDGWVNTTSSVHELQHELSPLGLQLVMAPDPAKGLWAGRPPIPLNPIEIQPIEYAGEEAHHKIERLRNEMRRLYASATLITQLDDIAWLTNLRGTDVHCCPLFVAYMTVTYDDATLFTDLRKVSPEVERYLGEQGIQLRDYTDTAQAVSDLPAQGMVADPDTCNARLWPEGKGVIEHASLVAPMKAIKNEAEIAGYRRAMHSDGVALVKFLRWLRPAVEAGGQTEISIDQKLTALRAEQPGYRDISFDTIAGYGAHGAIVHYEATPETDIPLEPHGLLLLDSGAQYQYGTTDITRTIALGPLTEEERTDYTLVLKGHIRLAMAKFPSGSSGTQLDVLARYAMWQQGINFLHGTGHGVGSYLNVHEGPHQFRMNYVPAPLLANMTITNEPGIYKAGKHGCRTENTMLITHYCDGELGEFLQFEPLTLCPIDTTPIRREMMLPDELEWLNRYHQHVYDELAPLLADEADRKWLWEATREF